MDMIEETLSRETVFKGDIIEVRRDTARLPNGDVASREVVAHPGGVCVVPLCDNGDVLLIRQFRYPFGRVLLEVPAGKREPKETPFACGIRELSEEMGVKAETYRSLGELYPTPGYCGEVITMYLATGLTFGEAHPDKDELLEVVRMPLKRAVEMVLDGEIPDAKTQTALLKARMIGYGG